MSSIKKVSGVISKIIDLSPTARDFIITLNEPLPFVSGAFVNLFVEHNGEKIRRAFSMSSSDTNENKLALSIRNNLNGKLTPLFWAEDFTGRTVEVMGPLGLNTADKMSARRVFLFGFGIGAGVVKSLAAHIAARPDLEELTIATGNRSSNEIIHKDYFDELARNNSKVKVRYVLSDKTQNQYPTGYLQENLAGYDFNNADVYMCGQTVACTALEAAIKDTNPSECKFFVEDFH